MRSNIKFSYLGSALQNGNLNGVKMIKSQKMKYQLASIFIYCMCLCVFCCVAPIYLGAIFFVRVRCNKA